MKIPTQNSPSLKNFAPRLGFAWRPLASDRFVVRGGAGYFYDRVGWLITDSGPQAEISVCRRRLSIRRGELFLDGSPTLRPNIAGMDASLGEYQYCKSDGDELQFDRQVFDPNSNTPTTYEWNLNSQYEFLHQWVLEVGYVGTRGIHQAFRWHGYQPSDKRSGNSRARPIPLTALLPIRSRTHRCVLPYLGFGPGGLSDAYHIGDSKFNSLQATVRKQFSHGFQLQAAYTFSRSFTTVPYVTLANVNPIRSSTIWTGLRLSPAAPNH